MPRLKLHVLDVGQGSSAVLDFGDHRYGIIDCGGATGGSEARIVRFMRRARDASASMRILFLLVTHLDLDHVRAINGLLKDDPDLENRVEKLYCNDLAYRTLLKAVRAAVKLESGIGVNPSNRSTMEALYYLGDLVHRRSQKDKNFHSECLAPEASDPKRYPVRLRVPALADDPQIDLWAPSQWLRDVTLGSIDRPPRDLLRAVFSGGREVEEWNTGSVVMTVSVAGHRLLIAGDATQQTWHNVLERAGELWQGADVAVAWHHGARLGSKDGTDYDALVWRRVLAREGKIVCISCGSGNRYAHPHDETLGAIKNHGGQIYCTQRKKSVRDSSSVGTDDSIMLLRMMSKSDLWVEDDGTQCCGDIVVEIGPPEGLVVKCSTGDCAARASRFGCCTSRTMVPKIA